MDHPPLKNREAGAQFWLGAFFVLVTAMGAAICLGSLVA